MSIRSRIALMRASEDRGMMSMVMIVIIVGMGLAVVMTPLVVVQSRATSHTDARVQALHAAETGVNVMLGQLRDAIPAGGLIGSTAMLPCFDSSSGTKLLGNQPGAAATNFNVALDYFSSDPIKALAAGTTLTPLKCVVGQGLKDLTGAAATPTFARITANGVDGSTTRKLVSTYAFDATNVYNRAPVVSAAGTPTPAPLSAGGQIRLNPQSTATTCLAANGGTTVGTPLTVKDCNAPDAATMQFFVWNTDLSLRLMHSITASTPYGLCVDSPATTYQVTLQPCQSVGSSTYNQQWRYDDNSALYQTWPDGTRACLSNSSVNVVSGKACAASYDPTASWLPTPFVGTGSAGAATGQLVNLSQFSRCVQVTNNIAPTAAANPFMILSPCAQSTSSAPAAWYQNLAYDAASKHWLTTNPADAQQYCLTSAGTVNGYVTMTLCNATNTLQRWTDHGSAAADQSNASVWPYLTSRYTITDSNNLCLSLSVTTGATPDWFIPSNSANRYSKLITATCDPLGAAQQKWNANPDPNSSVLKNISEVDSSGS